MKALLDSRSPWASLVAGFTGAMLLMLATRSAISHPPTYDELLHVLAARGVVSTGEPAILGGIYERAELFTRWVAWVFESRGESLWAARLPALVSGMALIVLTGGWVTRQAGLLAGMTAAVLLAVTVTSVELAVFARFYTLHALVVMVMFVATYEACGREQSRTTKFLWGGLALAAIPVAWHLQETTLIAVGATLLGLAVLIAIEQWPSIAVKLRRHPRMYLLAAVGLMIVALVLARYTGIVEKAGAVPFLGGSLQWRCRFLQPAIGLSLAARVAVVSAGRYCSNCRVPPIWPVLRDGGRGCDCSALDPGGESDCVTPTMQFRCCAPSLAVVLQWARDCSRPGSAEFGALTARAGGCSRRSPLWR